jgi:hypothetical protein
MMTDFVTDIATITNANTLLLQAKLEDLINDLQIDIANTSIGTDTPINYLKANTVILQNTGFIYQTGSPTPTVIASLTKNGSNESILQVDRLITNIDAGFDAVTLNDLIVNTTATFNGTPIFNTPITINSSVIESKESITSSLTWDGTPSGPATASITLSSTSRQNIFVTLSATSSPTPNAVYNGSSAIDPSISEIDLIINFDIINPPAQNTKFTIYIVNVVNAAAPTISIISAVQGAGIPIKLIGGTNNFTSTSIITHDGVQSVGLADSINLNTYGSNVTFNYILDSNNNDRLVASSLVGTELF